MPFTKNDPNINRNGRPPKDQSWAEITRTIAGGPIPETLKAATGTAQSLREAVVLKLYEMALGGDLQAIKLIQERSEGRPKQMAEFLSMDPIVEIQRVIIGKEDAEL